MPRTIPGWRSRSTRTPASMTARRSPPAMWRLPSTSLVTEGVPQFRLFYKGTTVKAIAPLTVRIDLGQPGKENMLSLLSLPVMPEASGASTNSATAVEACRWPAGHIRISAWRMGQYIIYSRVADYWAADLPVNCGR